MAKKTIHQAQISVVKVKSRRREHQDVPNLSNDHSMVMRKGRWKGCTSSD